MLSPESDGLGPTPRPTLALGKLVAPIIFLRLGPAVSFADVESQDIVRPPFLVELCDYGFFLIRSGRDLNLVTDFDTKVKVHTVRAVSNHPNPVVDGDALLGDCSNSRYRNGVAELLDRLP